ncbi:1969_t:CDS:2, partial [Racocetra persica]
MSKFQYIVDGLIKSQEIVSAFIHDILNYEKSLTLINNESHWAINCEQIPQHYHGYCFWCWKTDDHMVKDCLAEKATKPPWLTIQEYQVLQKTQLQYH